MFQEEFKEFRDSAEGKSVQEDIYKIIKNRILNIFQITNESFSKEDFDSMLTVTKLDFNDKLIELLCKKKNMLLLTHDFDFSLSDVDILSANRNLDFRVKPENDRKIFILALFTWQKSIQNRDRTYASNQFSIFNGKYS